MCGIIGISSNKSVSANIINSLKKLEYRGYDSAGIATLSDGFINEVKSEGRVENLEKNFDLKTSSWLKTPSDIRKLGGAIFGDYRYGNVFLYHNGADSYYAARGFRGSLKV